ncbi:asparaginase [Geodermatophilus sp. SYSU D00965]
MGSSAQRPRVAVGSLGGTITMTAPAAGGGVQPALTAADLLAGVPALAEVADLAATTLQTVPSAWLTPADVVAAADWAGEQVAAGAAGVVLVQGTDTIEETVYLLDLLWDRPEPVVVTGAMRNPSSAGADGPANLLAAVRVAADPGARDRGALVVFADEVHAAARVRKTDSTALQAFTSGVFGALGRVHEQAVTFAGRAARWPALPRPLEGRDPRVALLETALGDRGELLALVAEAGWDGVVVAGFGAGHVSATAAEVVGAVAGRCPVVLATRTGGGPVLSATYGFVGSEEDLLGRGVLPAGWLDPRKARLLLWTLLAAGADAATVRATVTARGAAPGGPAQAGPA